MNCDQNELKETDCGQLMRGRAGLQMQLTATQPPITGLFSPVHVGNLTSLAYRCITVYCMRWVEHRQLKS